MRLHLCHAVCILAPLAFSLSLLFGDTGSSRKLSPAKQGTALIFSPTRAHHGCILTTQFEVFLVHKSNDTNILQKLLYALSRLQTFRKGNIPICGKMLP